MNVKDSMVNMEGRKEGTTTTSRDCPSSQDKEKIENEQEN
jgi:hypothetical protein